MITIISITLATIILIAVIIIAINGSNNIDSFRGRIDKIAEEAMRDAQKYQERLKDTD